MTTSYLFSANNTIDFIGNLVNKVLLDYKLLYLILIIIIILLFYYFYMVKKGIIVMPFDVESASSKLSGRAISDLLIASIQKTMESNQYEIPLHIGVNGMYYSKGIVDIKYISLEKMGLISPSVDSLSLGSTSFNIVQILSILRNLLPGVSKAKIITGSIQTHGESNILSVLMEDKKVHTWILECRESDRIPELVHKASIKIVDKLIWDYLDYLNEKLKSDPLNADLLSSKGFTLINRGFYKEALNEFEKSTKSDPTKTSAYCGKGFALLGLKNVNESLKAFDYATGLDPKLSIAWYGKGLCQLYIERQG